ncbi:MAG: hypothetical protein J5787_00950 [Alphaproteobacteria bacterium]|nr:hypothetical protein [Alphaproteobacteria bacterium]MBO4643412.1 hypothetical protein [Alphaproteobacteria bacterium]
MTTENNISAVTDFSFDKEKDIPFSVPIHIELDDNGDTVELRSFAEAGLFASSELKAWHDIIGSEKATKPFLQKIIDFQLQTPRSVFSAAKAVLSGEMTPAEGFAIIRKDLNAYLGFKCIHSQGTLGKMATIMYRYEPMLMGLLAGATGAADLSEAAGFSTSSDAESFTFGYAFTLQFRTNIQPEMLDGKVSETLRKINSIIRRVEMAEKQIKPLENEHLSLQKGFEEATRQLQSYRNDVAEYVSRLVAEIKQTSDSAVNAMWDQLNLIQNDHERQLASLRQSVASRIRYGTALDYWNEQLKQNQTKTNQMTGWYVISGLFAIIAVLMIVAGISFKMPNISTFMTTVTLGLPIAISCGLMFMLIQTRIRYEKAAAQAQEKVSMLETLAALETEGKAKDEDREGILENVFKTSFTPPPASVAEESEEEQQQS